MDALLAIGETAIGSALGFMFGLIAFHYQQKRTKEAAKAEAQKNTYDAVDRLAQSAALNIEAVAIVKNLLSDQFVEDCTIISEIKDRYFESADRDKANLLSEIKHESLSLEHFFMFSPQVTNSPFPSSDQYVVALREVPILNLLVFRAESMICQLNGLIDKRNHFIDMYASDGGINMAPDRYVYRIAFLSDAGKNIATLLDDCLAILWLVFKQADKYLEAKAEGVRRHRYQIAPNALSAMPAAGRFETLEEQIVEFE